MFCTGVEHSGSDGLQGGELRGAQVLRNIEGARVDELLKAKIGWGLGDRPEGGEVLVLGTDGHDTILLMKLAYVRVLIGRWKEEEKSLLGMLDSPPKVVCRFELFCAGLWK